MKKNIYFCNNQILICVQIIFPFRFCNSSSLVRYLTPPVTPGVSGYTDWVLTGFMYVVYECLNQHQSIHERLLKRQTVKLDVSFTAFQKINHVILTNINTLR